MKKIVILYSGGLDSFLMKKYAEIKYPSAEIICVYYKHGADSEDSEISLLPDFVEIKKIDWLDEKIKPLSKKSDPFASNIYIPGRNLIFASLAACQYLPDEIWLGVLIDECNEQATDKNNHFRNLINNTLNYVLSPFLDCVKVRFPFVEEGFSKADTIAWAIKNGVLNSEIEKTISCWHAKDGKHCGKCKQCLKRFFVFDQFNLKTEYMVHPLDVPEQISLCDKFVENFKEGLANEDETLMANMIINYREKHA